MPPDPPFETRKSLSLSSEFSSGRMDTSNDGSSITADTTAVASTPFGKHASEFPLSYTLQRSLMSGSYGTVYLGINNSTKSEVAVKVIDRTRLSSKDDAAQASEARILKSLRGCPGIIKLINFYEGPEKYYAVMELARGGDVFERLAKRKREVAKLPVGLQKGVYTECDARALARTVVEALDFMHRRGIAHRDIKPENLLLMDEDDESILKLADFGFAAVFDPSDPEHGMKTKCGTPAFCPPEILAGRRYGPKCDVWSTGCTLFMLLSGRAPFASNKANPKSRQAMFYQIRAADYVFYEKHWGHVTIEARQLVVSMLQPDPKVRSSCREVLESAWMLKQDDDLRTSSLFEVLDEIVAFNARRKLKGAIEAVRLVACMKGWDINAASMWRDNLHKSTRALDGNEEDEHLYPDNIPGFEDLYELEHEVWDGGSEIKVWEAKSRETQEHYAVKIFSRENFDQADDAFVLHEVAILKSLRHPRVVPLLDFFEEEKFFCLVMKMCNGGNLLDRISSVKEYSEKEARELSKGLLEGIAFIHERQVAHRDIRAQTVLLDYIGNEVAVRICDFGYAKRVLIKNSLTTSCGNPYYVAPEILKSHPYDEAVDMWSVGVIIYYLLSGNLPFKPTSGNDFAKLYKLIRLGFFRFDEEHFSQTTKEATHLVTSLLEVDPSKRTTAAEALKSDWILMDDVTLINNALPACHKNIKEEVEKQTLTKGKSMLSATKQAMKRGSLLNQDNVISV